MAKKRCWENLNLSSTFASPFGNNRAPEGAPDPDFRGMALLKVFYIRMRAHVADSFILLQKVPTPASGMDL